MPRQKKTLDVHEKSVENGKICNQTTMGERLERIGEVWIVDETDCFRLVVYREDREKIPVSQNLLTT